MNKKLIGAVVAAAFVLGNTQVVFAADGANAGGKPAAQASDMGKANAAAPAAAPAAAAAEPAKKADEKEKPKKKHKPKKEGEKAKAAEGDKDMGKKEEAPKAAPAK